MKKEGFRADARSKTVFKWNRSGAGSKQKGSFECEMSNFDKEINKL
jgi:hypothetical protein